MSYKKECQETNLPPGPMPVLFRRGIQPNCLNVHPRSESGLAQAECPVSSYKKECQETNLPPGPMPVLFRRGIQPNCLNVHPRSESGLAQAECPVSSPRAKRRY